MDDESCYAAIRLTQKGQPTQNVPLTYPRKKFDPRKITHAKLSVKRTHDPRKYTHDPRKVTHVPRPTTHDPRRFSNPRDPRNPRNLAHSPRCLARSDCFNFIRNKIRINVQKNFIEQLYLFIRACHVVKMFVPSKHFNAFPNSYKVGLIVVPNLTGVWR